MVCLVMFRAKDLPSAAAVLGALVCPALGAASWGFSPLVAWQLKGWSLNVLALSIPLIFGGAAWRRAWAHAQAPERLRLERWQLAFIPAFVLAVLRLSAQSYTPFLYFQF
jgi:alginate O-acetyltransferase complex protein AlgI